MTLKHEIPPAKTLAERYENAQYASAQTQLSEVQKRIEKAAENGIRYVSCGILEAPVRSILTELGYKVETYNDCRESGTIIRY